MASFSPPTVSFIAIGDELVEGRVINSNSAFIAKALQEAGFNVHQHVLVRDSCQEIISYCEQLAIHCDCIITIGGLGPTSDDKTRFALADFLNKPLQANATALLEIKKRLQGLNIPLKDNNIIQAHVPEGAFIFPNDNGTACGFAVSHSACQVIALPGPKSEIKPMFYGHTLPWLKEQFQLHPPKVYYWKTIGIPESVLAATLDPILTTHDIKAAYCWHYPYIDFSIHCSTQQPLPQPIEGAIDAAIGEHLFGKTSDTASQKLRQLLENKQYTLRIDDQVTGGRLLTKLVNPKTFALLHPQTEPMYCLLLGGLQHYWERKKPSIFSDTIEITLYKHGALCFQTKKQISLRQEEGLEGAAEFSCYFVLQELEREIS